MSLATEVIKSRMDVVNPTSTKVAKKEASTKQGDNKSQPTSEQLRIAQLINTKKEDPKLKEKLKQVMDATQRTMEEAYLALHDSEFDPNKAVNLLLEGDVETEWSTLSKKKKTRTLGEKPIKNKTENVQEATQQCEPWDSSLNAKPSIGNRGSNYRGRGGRSFRGRGGGFQQSDYADRGRRFNRANNAANCSDEPEDIGIIQSRTFERVVPPTVRPVDTWDPKRPISSKLNQNRSYDWDEEEYTGSLSSSLVYTSSGSSSQTKLSSSPMYPTAPPLETKQLNLYEECDIQPTLPSFPSPIKEQIIPTRILPPINTPKSLPPPITSCCTSVPAALKIRSPPLGANVTKPPRIDKPKENQEIPVDRGSCKLPTKLSSKPVEMPPHSVSNSMGLLDIQFGSLDLKDGPNDAKTFSLQPSNSQTSKLSENRMTNLNTSDSSSHIFSGSPSAVDSLPPTSSSNKDNLSQVSVSPLKPLQTPSVYSSQYLSGLATTASKNTGSHQNTYSTSSGGVSGGASNVCPQYHCGNYVTQPSQSVPVVPNITNSYQNLLGTQSYTSSTQSIYGSTALPTSSYSTPYQTYSSTAQHKPTILPAPFTTSKDFESGNQNVSLSLSTRSAVPTASSMLSSNQSFSSTKPTTVPKSPVLSNMPPIIGHHQHPMFIGQGGIPYFQPPIYYQDLQLMQQQRLASPINAAYYDIGYPSLARDGVPYNINDRVLPKQENTQTLPHGHQMIGGCASGHLGSSTVFGTETEHYIDRDEICENTSSDSCEPSPSCQLIPTGMTLLDSSSNDTLDMCSKSTSMTQKKINEYD